MEDRWLTTQEIGERLGVTAKTVRRWCATRRMPHMRLTPSDIRLQWGSVSQWAEGECNGKEGRKRLQGVR